MLKNNWHSIKNKREREKETRIIDNWYSILYIFVNMNNIRDTNYFTKKFTTCWYNDWLLVNEKVILMVGLDKNQ